jgi:proline iminopeptidase
MIRLAEMQKRGHIFYPAMADITIFKSLTDGPGLPVAKGITRVVDTRHFHLLQIHYRGTVNSTPRQCIENNTTSHLVNDGMRLLDILGVWDFYQSGFCFGTLVATAMAAEMPERCKGMGLFFPYTSSALDDQWLFDGVKNKNALRANLWDTFSRHAEIPLSGASYLDLLDAYYRAVHAGDKAKAQAYAIYQGDITGCLCLSEAQCANENPLSVDQHTQVAMELHYAANKYFMGDDGVIPLMSNLSSIPMHIIYSTENDSFHPGSIHVWKETLPHATFVDTLSHEHHMLSESNKPLANEMFNWLKTVSEEEKLQPQPSPSDVPGRPEMALG